jgi:uncharacterized protein (TIGR04255 family)
MLMLFPDTQRIIYDNNTLEEVICQLRFPPILRIDAEIPSKYQESIRREYPFFVEPPSPETSLGIPPEIAKLLGGEIPFKIGKSVEFLSADRLWKVSLTREFMALSTRAYKRWANFKEQLMGPLNALIADYQPAFFTRIGLRYRNIINRPKLSLNNTDWRDLLNPQMLGELADPDRSLSIEQAISDFIFRLDEHGRLRVKHGLAPQKSGEVCYLIDSDFFAEGKVVTTNAIGILDDFNQQAHRFFRWCIQDKLHAAMGPKLIES